MNRAMWRMLRKLNRKNMGEYIYNIFEVPFSALKHKFVDRLDRLNPKGRISYLKGTFFSEEAFSILKVPFSFTPNPKGGFFSFGGFLLLSLVGNGLNRPVDFLPIAEIEMADRF